MRLRQSWPNLVSSYWLDVTPSDVDQRRVLDQQDELVGQRRDDDPEGLRDARSMRIARRGDMPSDASRLDLSLRYRLDAGSDRLGHVGRRGDPEADHDLP